jgi:signal transduction histidine kinase
MNLNLSVYVIVYSLTALVNLIIAAFCWRRRHIAGGLSLTLMLLALAVWAFGDIFEMATVQLSQKILWAKVAYLGTVSASPLFFSFALEYSHHEKWLTRRNRAILWSISAIAFILALTNEWHGWIWNSFTPSPTDPTLYIYGRGLGFWGEIAYLYTLLVGALIVLGKMYITHTGTWRQQIGLVILGSIAPFIVSIIDLTGSNPIPGLDLTPAAFTFTGGVIAWSLFYYQLLDLVPIARDLLVENMNDGVVVLDTQHRIVDVNPAAKRIMANTTLRLGQPFELAASLMAQSDSLKEWLTEIKLSSNPLCYLEMNAIPLYSRHKRLTGHLIFLRDITQRKSMQMALQEMNTNLEHLVSERTRELSNTVSELENEIAERKRVEETLRHMENVLTQRVADQTRKLSGLYELILFAGQSLSIAEIQEQALSTIMTVMGSDMGCIHQWDEKKQSQVLVTQRGLSQAMQSQINTLPANWLLNDRIPCALPNLPNASDVPNEIKLERLPSYLGASTYLLNRPIGSISLYWTQARSFPVEDIALFSGMADQLGIIIENTRLRQRGEAAAAMQERRRLARDLHDSVTQSLHSLVLVADTANNRLKQGKLERLESSLTQLAESARQALKEMRLLLYELRLANPDQLNLVDAIRLRLDTVEKRAGLDVQFIVQESSTIPRDQENQLYFITMEALNNSLKYSRATHVQVELIELPNGIDLKISDNGKGIEPQTTRPGGLGLQNMAERAERLGGTLKIQSAPGTGTCVHFSRREES